MEVRSFFDVNLYDLEFGQTSNGNLKANFSVVYDQEDQDGNEVDVWTNCEAYGRVAKMLKGNEAEGRRVSLSGEMQHWKYQGEEYSKLVVNTFRYVDSPSSSGGESEQQQNGQMPPDQTPSQPDQPHAGADEDFEPDGDLPF